MQASGASVGLLEDAVRYALGPVGCVTPRLLSCPTPCAAWDVGTLLGHMNDSVETLLEGVATGRISRRSVAHAADPAAGGLVATFRNRVGKLVAAFKDVGSQTRVIVIGDRLLSGRVAATVAAIEIAVHGWDIARACGCHRPIPSALATGILDVVPLVVNDRTRRDQFAAPLTVSPRASPGDRLVAQLGRDPTV
jgi:uncharacterized protein (TIGR03086 family)